MLADLLTLWVSHMDQAKVTPYILSQNHKQGQLIRLVLRKRVLRHNFVNFPNFWAPSPTLSIPQVHDLSPAQQRSLLQFQGRRLRHDPSRCGTHLAASLALAIHLSRRSNISLWSICGDSMRLRMASSAHKEVEEAQRNQNETRETHDTTLPNQGNKPTHSTQYNRLYIQCTHTQHTHVTAKAAEGELLLLEPKAARTLSMTPLSQIPTVFRLHKSLYLAMSEKQLKFSHCPLTPFLCYQKGWHVGHKVPFGLPQLRTSFSKNCSAMQASRVQPWCQSATPGKSLQVLMRPCGHIRCLGVRHSKWRIGTEQTLGCLMLGDSHTCIYIWGLLILGYCSLLGKSDSAFDGEALIC